MTLELSSDRAIGYAWQTVFARNIRPGDVLSLWPQLLLVLSVQETRSHLTGLSQTQVITLGSDGAVRKSMNVVSATLARWSRS